MKILIFVKSMDGGTGTFALNLLELNHFKQRQKIDLQIVSLSRLTYRKINNSRKIIFLNKSFHYPFKYYATLRNLASFVAEVFLLKKIINSYRPDILFSIDIHCNLIALINKFFSPNLKVFINNRINLEDTLKAKSSPFIYILLKAAVKVLYKKADKILAVSHGVKRDLIRTFGIKKYINVIPNGIAIRGQHIMRRNNEANRLLTVGRLDSQKDYETLLKAFVIVHKKIKESRLIIVGDGPQKEHIQKMIDSFHINNCTELNNWTDNVEEHYKKADIFVFSSLRDGFPNVLLEAMNSGLPVVSTDTPFGPSELLGKNEYGLLVPMKDPAAMAKAIYQLIKNHKKYMYYSHQSTKRVKDFSLERMLNAYYQLFASVGKD